MPLMKAVGRNTRDQREGGGDHRQADLVGRLHGRLVWGLAHAQVAHDVFHLHDGVVHQNAHHQRQRQQRDDVDGKAQQIHADERRNDRQRQRHGRDEGGARIAQEQPHHQHRQQCALIQQVHGAVVFLLHRRNEVEGLGDFQAGVLCAQLCQCGLHGGAYLDLARALAARYFEAHHRLAVEQRQRARLGHGVAHRGQLVQAHRAPVGQRDRQAASSCAVCTVARVRTGCSLPPRSVRPPALSCCTWRSWREMSAAVVPRACSLSGSSATCTWRSTPPTRLTAPTPRTVSRLLGHVVVHEPGQRLVVHAARCNGVGQHRLRRPGPSW
jgi:hypothetical protein